jgi:hypothetical protein
MGFAGLMGLIGIALGIRHTFFEQSIVPAIAGISSASAMYYLVRNPKILMARTFDEFGALYDASRDKKYLWGTPLCQSLIFLAVLYILLV